MSTKVSTRVFAALLALCMVIGLVPLNAFAVETDTLKSALDEALAYTDALTVDNSSNDPATVVSNFKTHFTWDNEKRENSKDYLYDWSYYNGVVFEGLEYLYEVTKEEKYKDYVVEYMSSLITADGEWATCANNSAKTAAGYNEDHGADCYKTASLLLDAYEMTGDKRYLEIADELYEDLDDAASFYSLADAGNNYRHTWASDPSPDLWLDGLYMILPFRAEYAAYLNDTEELDLIVDRLQWVSDNMYDQETGLFYHAADNAEENSGTYWLRAIGWYAAAIVDVKDTMEGENLEAMKAQLVKLVDGMWDCQNAENGMWRNNVLSAASSTNPYETSGTALVGYAVMKAVNNGWLDETYADMAIASFEGICNEKLNGTVLTDICFKGVPGSGNEKFYDNEGKGAGPFIMFTAEVLEYYNALPTEPEVPETTAPYVTGIKVVDNNDGVYYAGSKLNLTVYEVYSDGTEVEVTGYTTSGFVSAKVGYQTVIVTYGDYSTTVGVTVQEVSLAPTLSEIRVSYTVDALLGDELVLNVTAVYANGETKVLAEGEYTVTGYDPDANGAQTVIVTYETASYAFTIVRNADTGVSVLADTVGALTVTDVTDDDTVVSAMADVLTDGFVAYDITPESCNTEKNAAVVSAPVPSSWAVGKLVVYYIDAEGKIAETIPAEYANGKAVFTTNHFSTYVLGYLEGETTVTYELVPTLTTGKQYLIVNINSAGSGYALGSTTAGQTVTVNSGAIITDKGNAVEWTASGSGSSWSFNNGNGYLGYTQNEGGSFLNGYTYTYTLNPAADNIAWTVNGSSLYINLQTSGSGIFGGSNAYADHYLVPGSTWSMSTTETSGVYFYEKVENTIDGAEVELTVNKDVVNLLVGQEETLTTSVKVNGVETSDYNIYWRSSDTSVATVNGGTITAKAAVDTTITATLIDANGTAVSGEVKVDITVKVSAVTVEAISVQNASNITTCVHKDADFSNVYLNVDYSDGSTKPVTSGFTFDYDNKPGEQTVTVSYEGKTATFTITVQEEVVATKTLVGPSLFTFGQGGNATFSGLSVDLTYNCECTENVTTGLTVSGYNIDEPGTYENCPVMYNGEQIGAVKVVVTAYTPVSGEGYLTGSKTYVLDTNGVTPNKNYLIVNTGSNGTGYALTNNSSNTPGSTAVEIADGEITVDDDANIAWVFSATTGSTIKNGTRYIYLGSSNVLSTDYRSLTISNQGSGAYRIYRSGNNNYYLCYASNSWSRTTSASNVYLYEYVSESSGGTVVFTVDKDALTIKTGETGTLNATVTLDGEPVSLSDCTIVWSSSNTDYATVNGGTVTGEAVGTATVTATLTHVDGKALATAIALPVTVRVQDLAVTSAVLSGNGTIQTTLGVAPDYSNIKYVITYEDGSNETHTVGDGLTVSACDVETSGNKVVQIYYKGEMLGTVVVNVTVEFSLLDPAENYPQYPNDGAVRIDKTATHNADEFKRTGVTHVELDVAGISVRQGVDVILVADISNSMAWKAGSENTSPGTGETTKWQDLQAAADSFVDVLLAENEDGTVNTNTVSFVIFGGYDADRNANSSNYSGYFDATKTVFTGYTDPMAAKDKIDSYSITGTDSAGYTATIDGESASTPQGGTNYDYAFNEAAAAIAQLKAQYAAANNGASYDNSGREIYIVFMTDGAPDHYNQLYYKSRSNSQFDYYALYFNDEDPITADTEYFDTHSVPTYNTFRQNTTYGYYMPTSGNVTNANWIKWIQSDSLYAAEKVMDIPGVKAITSVGFDLANGAFSNFTFGESVLTPVLANLAGPDSCDVFTTDDSGALNEFYVNLANEIRYAGTEAVATDTVGNNFSVQMLPYVLDNDGNQIALATPPSITVKTYDLYPRGSVDTEGNDITGKRTGTSANVETVTFAEVNGKLQAYSSVIGAGVNILTTDADGNMTISAKNFTYTKNAATSKEEFVWTIGNITDKEIALAFDAYLEGSMEGKRPEDVYYTNEEAIIEYVDINGDYATQTFPIPGVAWGGATTTIRFYLVNEKGQPVNRDGDVIPWENRVYVGEPVVVALNLNADLTIAAQKVEAAAYVPAQFFLYDANAYYTVQTSSSGEAITGGISVSDPSEDAKKTTGTAPNQVTQTGAQTTRVISAEEEYYTWSYVGFGVRWDLTSEKTEYVLTSDQVVIDYGKAIQVDVLANDVERDDYNRELVGFIKYTAGTDLSYVMENAGSATFTANYGAFSIVNDKVQYQPTKTIDKVERVFYAVKYTEKINEDNFYYVWGQLDVIPATIVYYESDFASGIFTTATTGSAWTTVSKGDAADGPQDAGTIGQNTYGFDTTYDNDAYLSNGSSYFVEGAGVKRTTVNFQFTGTGFDLISRTGAEQGSIRVDIYTDVNRTNRYKSITVLNKSESGLELYQIPVVSVNGLEHGTYYVTIGVNAAYNNTDYPALNRGGEFYFDAIRVYDPVKGDATAEAAYAADGEADSQIDEVRNLLISANTFEAIDSGSSTPGMVYVDSTYTGGEATGTAGNVVVADYAKVGPNNEVYLSNGQAIAFKVEANSIPASFDVGAKSITGETAGLKVVVTNQSKSWTVEKSIASSTVQYINLMTNDADASLFSGNVYVIITNTGDGVLSITDIKAAFNVSTAAQVVTANVPDSLSVMSAEAYDPYAVTYSVDANTLNVARSILIPEAEPEVPEVSEPNYNILDASVKASGGLFNLKFTVTVTTTQDVEDVKISQLFWNITPNSKTYEDMADGTRVWSIVLSGKATVLGGTYTVTGFGADGTTGEPAIVTIFR